MSLGITINTPAFLGNAEQAGQWRTPPFKAQLRQWWRVAYAASRNYKLDLDHMRHAEGRLFGHAWLEGDSDGDGHKVAARKSSVRIRLGNWSHGGLTKANWEPLASVDHPEVKARPPADLYLGFGPVVLPRGERRPTLKANAAIQAGDRSTFSIAYPEHEAALIEHALYLMDYFGSVGGRNRNGWGSYSLNADEGTLAGAWPLRAWQDCLALDWPHALGKDEKGALVWQTRSMPSWPELMKELAQLKIDLRTQFKFNTGKDAQSAEPRHWLSYPVTHHSVKAWGGTARLPNSLRFKVRPSGDGGLVGVIFHVPHLPPAAFMPKRTAIEAVWRTVHSFLDARPLIRSKA